MAPTATSERPCPVCDARESEAFLRIPAAPVTCATIFATRNEALAVPNGAVRLVACSSCGFVFNDLFDAALGAAAANYESSQAASAHFSAFARSLARDWLDRHDLRGKPILEVGCGSGDFLRLMVDEGAGCGTGIDPCAPDSDALPNVRFLRANFGPAHFETQAVALVCRHTLEHIQDVSAFLRVLHSWAARDPARVLLFELPGSERIFAERAFWDVYYEHCNYFTTETLRFAFELHGFEVTRLDHAYGGQYLILEARVAASCVRATKPDASAVVAQARAFAADVGRSIEQFRKKSQALAANGPIVLWQGASKTVGLLTAVGDAPWIACAVDMSPQRHDKFLPGSGLPVYAPEKLRQLRPEEIVLLNPVYLSEVRAHVQSLGLASRVHSINDLLD